MYFRAEFYDPFKQDINHGINEIGEVEKGKIMKLFESIPWAEYLKKVEVRKEYDILDFPSLQIKNENNQNSLSVSAHNNKEWYIIYVRPKLVKKFFGLIENNYMTSIEKQTEKEVRNCLEAFIKNDLQFLENKII